MATYIRFNGELTAESGDEIINQLLELRCQNEEILEANDRLRYEEDFLPLYEDTIVFQVNSEGGDLYKLIQIFELIDALKEQGVYFKAEVSSHAYSASFYLLMYMDEVYVSEYASLMYHSMLMGFDPINIYDLSSEIKRKIKLQEKLDQLVLNNTTIPKELLAEHKDKDLYFDYNDCIKYGIVKELEVIKPKMSQDEFDKYVESLKENIEIVED